MTEREESILESGDSIYDEADSAGMSAINDNLTPDEHSIDFLLTNARSLGPKIQSALDNLSERRLHFAAVTETWLKSGQTLDGDLIDLEHGSGVKILYRNRPAQKSGRTAGGGVALIYNKATCNFKQRRIKGNVFELMCAVGRVGKVARPVAIFVVYIPPKMKADELTKLRELISQEIGALQSTLKNPVILLGEGFQPEKH